METSQQAVETILKVDCEDDVRRALLKGTPTYADIDRAVQEIWPNRSAREAKYVDEEGDACTLTEHTFSDFLCTTAKTAPQLQMLRLTLSPAGAAVDTDRAPTATEAFEQPWQHVEQGSDAGDEGLHTVADLTDIQDGQDRTQECAQEVQSACPRAELAQQTARERSLHEVAVPTDATAQNLTHQGYAAGTPQNNESSMLDEFLLESVPDESLQAANRKLEEQTDIVIAAFDEDGDGILSFAEILALLKSACDYQLPCHVFNQICTDAGADADVGLDRDALMCIYSCGNSWLALERDFEAAKRKLEGKPPQPQSSRAEPHNPISLMLRNPLLAAPFALDVAERVRQGVSSQMK